MLHEIASLLRSQEYKAAARAFLEFHRLDPGTPLHGMVSRACLFTPAPEDALRGLCEALTRLGHGTTARRLHLRLCPPPAQTEEEESASFLARFPALYDIVNVASHTFTVWRKAV